MSSLKTVSRTTLSSSTRVFFNGIDRETKSISMLNKLEKILAIWEADKKLKISRCKSVGQRKSLKQLLTSQNNLKLI
jgi:hypothetical protein